MIPGSSRSAAAQAALASPSRFTPENVLGDRLTAITEHDDEELAVVHSVIDGLVAKDRLRTLAGGLS